MEKVTDVDTLMGYLGDFGKYQLGQFILHILAAITAGMHILSLATVAAVPEHRCLLPEIDFNGTMSNVTREDLLSRIPLLPTGEMDSCSLLDPVTNASTACSAWVFNTTYHSSSRAIEWGFVCERRWMGAVAQSAYMFGVFTGSIVLGNMADRYGRKPIFCWSAVLQLIFGVAVAFSPNYSSFVVCRYLYGIFGSAGSFITGFVLTMELVGPGKRSMCGIAFQFAFAGGIMLVAAWGALIKDRQLLQVIYGLHSVILMGNWWLMDESPRWLWGKGETAKAVAIVDKALRINGSPLSLQRAQVISDVTTKHSNQKPGLMDLFKTPNLRSKTLNVCLCFFANALVYYGLSLSTGNLRGNPFLMLFLTGLVELPGYIITIYLMDRLGRRPLTSFYMIFGGLCCIIAANLASGSLTSISFVMAGKFLISSSFAVIYNYSAELFPTVVRNSAMGLFSMCARTSGALTPFIALLDFLDPRLPPCLFAIVALISGVLTLILPETLDKPLPQTMEEGEKFGQGDTCFSCLRGDKVRGKEEKYVVVEQMQPLNKD